MGGKSNAQSWLKDCESLNLQTVFRPGSGPNHEFEQVAPMLHNRASFACLALKNFVYVFGGMSGANGHEPIMAPPIERYMPLKNEWEEMKINGAPRLSAFSWCPLSSDEGQIVVLGGSDGCLLCQDLYIVDFKAETCMHQNTDFEFSTGSGHLVFRPKENMLYHMGGFNSEGVNYFTKMGDNAWREDKRSHTNVTDSYATELSSNSAVFFK